MGSSCFNSQKRTLSLSKFSSLHLAVHCHFFRLTTTILLKFIMKCFVILAIIGMAHALPQYYLADTPEVQAAKQQFAAAYNAAASRAAAPQAVPAGIEDPSNYSPAAEPYVHEEIPAEEYVHIAGKNAAVAAPAQPAAPAYAPVAPAAPAYAPVQAAGPNYNLNFGFPGYAGYQPAAPAYQPAAPATFAGTCYNWKGEGVPCREQF